jgi:hypothetical protein
MTSRKQKIPQQIDMHSFTFVGCHSLVDIELCKGLEKIINNAFWECLFLESTIIPSSVKVIGKGVFQGCYKLTNIDLQDGLHNFAFGSCMLSDHFNAHSTLREIGTGAFEIYTDLVHIQLKKGLVTVGERHFQVTCPFCT